jgi:cell division protein FtsI/penicillin-binding protein 2
MSKGFASNYRIVLLATGVVACFCGIGVRLVFLHVIDREELVRSIEKVRRQIIVEHARRGDILDAKGNVLATSRSLIVLGVDPQTLRKEDEEKWPELARLIGMPFGEMSRVFTTKTRPAKSGAKTGTEVRATAKFAIFDPASNPSAQAKEVEEPATGGGAGRAETEDDTQVDEIPDENGERPIRWAKLREDVSESTYAKILALGVKGVYGNRVYRRAYPHNSLAAHMVGFVNKTGEPAAGIERYADFYLRGRDGWREGERDGKGREAAQFRTREVPASDGYSVVLSIDTAVQHIVEAELDYIAKTFQSKKATIVVTDPQTGFILALANYPNFDLNTYNEIPRSQQHVMRNLAVTDMYEPGSTFKIVAAAGALNERLVMPGTLFDVSMDVVDYKGRPRRMPRDDHPFHEPISVTDIIKHSSNRGAALLAMRLGDGKFYDYARAFGFGSRTGFPVGGEHGPESFGMIAEPKDWDGLTITRMPMGHSVAATPLQMHMAMSVIASGGLLLRPQVIKQIRDASGEVVYSYGPISKQRVVSETMAKAVGKMLMGVVGPDGPAKEIAIPHYQVAGKTGTTQKIIDGKYSTRHHVASFVGFFPASRPQVAISVIVDDADAHAPNGVAYGRTVAAPSFKRIGEQLIQYLDIKPVYSEAGGSNIVMGGVRQ